MRFLIAEGEPSDARSRRRQSVGRSSGETYMDLLRELSPGSELVRAKPADSGGAASSVELGAYDAVFLTGSPLHLYKETPQTRREIEFMQAVFGAGVPAFGSCAGLQLATVAAGGVVRSMARRMEAGFARRITPTAEGARHPLLAGRPAAYDAPAVHSDEVAELPDGAVLLATSRSTRVQAAEIRAGAGVFWGVQYHPEISLHEVAAALTRTASSLVREGLAKDRRTVSRHAKLIDELGRDQDRLDLAWRLGLDEEVTEPFRRTAELRNFIEHLVKPTASRRGRG